jgi:hypothetical protein
MNEIRTELTGVLEGYIGGELVTVIVEKNNATYANEKFTFIRLDLINDNVPMCDFYQRLFYPPHVPKYLQDFEKL